MAAVLVVIAVPGCGGSSHATSSSVTPESTTSTRTAEQMRTARAPAQLTDTSGATNVRLPATFTIGPGGALAPPSVSAPRSVAIELTVISGDGREHRVNLAGRELTVPAHGRATSLVKGLNVGSYRIEVDGRPHGSLIVGAQPGP